MWVSSARCPEPAPLHATLSSHQRNRLYQLRRDPTLQSRERDRVEALLLSADGMRVPQLARHFGCCQAAGCTILRPTACGPCATNRGGRGPTRRGGRPCAGP